MPASRPTVGLRSQRGPILLAIMMTTGLIAVDATILATAVPSIVRDLGGFVLFPWLFSIYMLAQAVSVPIFAKLSDIFGRKPLMLFGIGVFLLGSLLCGLAWSMPALIVFRAVQGIGAGAVQPMTLTIAGDIYSVAERATVQGYIASVWGVSAVLGPSLGGLFSQLGIWRWIFFVNVPLCLLAGWLILRTFHEQVHRRHHRIDYLGSALLAGGMSLLILGILQGGQGWAWASATSLGVFGSGTVLLLVFVVVQRRAAEPVLPLWVFTRRLLATTTALAFGVGAVLIGLTSFVPTYLENSLGVTPIVAGLALASLTIGWPIAATVSGRLFYLRWGFRPTILTGLGLVLLGTGTLAALAGRPSVQLVAVTCFVTGFGLGLVASPSLIAAQASVPWRERGVATGMNTFSRSIGSALGAAVFGAVANAVVASSGRPQTDPRTAAAAGTAVFVAVAVVAALVTVAGLAMPKVRADPEPA